MLASKNPPQEIIQIIINSAYKISEKLMRVYYVKTFA